MATKKPVVVLAPDAAADSPDLGTYLVGATPILQNGTRFAQGSTITCTPAQAARLGLQPTPVVTHPEPIHED